MTKIGIIGLGHMGFYHASVSSTIQNIDLVAIADPNEKNWEKLQTIGKNKLIKKSASFHEWLDDVDGVIIAVPTQHHHEVAKACLEKGKHILIEKPITKNFAQAQELFAIAEKNDLTLHTGHVERFNGAVQELKKLIHKPYLIESHRMGPFTPRITHDTVVLDLMIHDLDIIANLVGHPVKKLHVLDSRIKSSLSDLAVVQIEFENGTLANITSSRVSQIKKRMMSIHQEDTFIQLDFTTQDIFIHRHTTDSVNVGHNQMKYKQAVTVERLFVYKDNPLKLEIENFVESIRSGKNKRAPKKDLEALRLSLQIEQALGYGYDRTDSRDRQPAQKSV